ncbi:MAG: isoprenyl transferase [Prevotella sp.]|nr:isoprenyl transferase [Prevotella sp.]
MNNTVDMSRLPEHIAIIMDGNGRWAKKRGLDRNEGHKEGVEAVRRVTTACSNMGIKFLTLYTFSTENWGRPIEEVTALMGLILVSLEDEIFMKNNVRFRVIGDRSRIPDEMNAKLDHTIERTAKNDHMTMTIALSYSSKQELTSVTRQIASEVKAGTLSIDDISEDTINERLWTNFMPDPELLIRTGGELRISNYLLWQIAYSELYFCDTYWPDFGEEELCLAIADYQSRQRRFGKTEAQVGEETTASPKEEIANNE